MRRARIIGKPGSCYHVISRFVERQFALGDDRAKRVFRTTMLNQAAFSGVEILTYCLMGNHFHILVRVPEAPELGEEEVLRRLAFIWPTKRLERFKNTLAKLREISAQGELLVARELDQQRRRMYDLGEFVKDLKQRFSVWFNHTHERKGTLFEERYKSVLVQSGRALRYMAAYIDLNPVRAGIVDDPADYPWCGYSQAVGGNKSCREGLRYVLTDPRDTRRPSLEIHRKRYRLWLVERGLETHHRDGRQKKRGFSRADAIAAWEAQGEIPVAKLLRCKIRHLTDSLVFGSKIYVEEMISEHPAKLGIYAKPQDPLPVVIDEGDDSSSAVLCGLVRFRRAVIE